MNTETIPFTDSIPPDIQADLDAVSAALAVGQRPDPELVRRVRERARRATESIRNRCGELNIAVDLIRQSRDEV